MKYYLLLFFINFSFASSDTIKLKVQSLVNEIELTENLAKKEVLLNNLKSITNKHIEYKNTYFFTNIEVLITKSLFNKVLQDIDSILKKTPDKYTKAKVNLYKSIILLNLDNTSISLELLTQSLLYFKKENKTFDTAFTLNELGSLYMNLNNFEKAEVKYLEALEILINKKNNNKFLKEFIYNNLIVIYLNTNNLKKAILYQKKLENCIKTKIVSQGVLFRYYLNNFRINLELKNKNKSKLDLIQLKNIADKNNNTIFYGFYYWYKSYYFFEENSTNSINLINKAILYFKSVDSKKNLLMVYKTKIHYLKNKNNYKIAFETLEEYNLLYNNLKQINIEYEQKITDLIKAEQTKKTELIQRKNFYLKNEKQKLHIIYFSLLLVVIIFGLIYYNFNKVKMYKNNLSVIKKQQSINNLKSFIKGEEIERRRISLDLHDSLGGIISALFINLSNFNFDKKEVIINLLVLIKTELKKISNNLIPENIAKSTFKNAINDYIDSLGLDEKYKISVQFINLTEIDNLSQKLAAYRIIQELLTNAIKYSNSNQIIIQVSNNNGILNIVVEDNGVGFDSKNVSNWNGLNNVKSRLEVYDGTFHIESVINVGTTIICEMKLIKENE